MAENYSFRSAVNGFNRNDVMEFIEKLLIKNEENEKKLEELEVKLKEKEKKIAMLNGQIEVTARKCDNCDVSTKCEARLGAAMLDAKRFSEVLVKEANEKVADIYENASKTAVEIYAHAEEIYNSVIEASSKYEQSFSELTAEMITLMDSVSEFSKAISESKNDNEVLDGGEDVSEADADTNTDEQD